MALKKWDIENTLTVRLRELISMAGSDEWHLHPTVVTDDGWLNVIEVCDGFDPHGVLCLLENGYIVEMTEWQAREEARATSEVFAHTEDEILYYMGH